ncbi:DUF6152 family protein [Gammaproteobacteria bacterium]|jgi:hypothetical protein|nr:DUF6152 family protein [Gammaproteobacteria bacterium]|tara:strand:- start:888 stop:1268 length:381 start_codon:yes stop_codon:yes gene_type:complete
MKRNIFLLFFFCITTYTVAHHSTNANFTQEIISVVGLIEQVRFQNPHASVLIKNIDDTGSEQYWLIEASSRTTLQRQGVTFERLEIGAKIIARGRKGRRNYTMYLQSIDFEDGTTFIPEPDAYSDR